MRSILKNKKGAIELSMTTVVVIVLSMTMLILGLTLVRTIFQGATGSIDTINDKVQAQINNLFADQEQSNLGVLLGSDNIAKVPADTASFGVALVARTLDGTPSSRERLQYKMTLDQASDCIKKNSKAYMEGLFTGLGTYKSFDGYEGDTSYAFIKFSVPSATALCSQTVYLDVKDTKLNRDVGGTYFILQVVRKGVFG